MGVFDLTGRVALVTGAGQGVGAGIARALAGQGAMVVVNDARAERAAEVVASLTDSGLRGVAAAFDVTDHAEVAEAFARVAADHGVVDILVNNAGNGGVAGMRTVQFKDSSPSDWSGPIDVNLFGVLNCCRAAINPMCEQGRGRIITISSGAGMTGLTIGVSAYAAGKGGAIGFMRHLAVENARSGVTANTVAIGLMEMSGPREVTEHLARSIPVGRLGRPDDIGAMCTYLASDEASWMTGQTVHLNGGSVQS